VAPGMQEIIRRHESVAKETGRCHVVMKGAWDIDTGDANFEFICDIYVASTFRLISQYVNS